MAVVKTSGALVFFYITKRIHNSEGRDFNHQVRESLNTWTGLDDWVYVYSNFNYSFKDHF
jgi:hypothetical protein